MHRILAGIETEYGFTVEGRGAEDQIDDATQFVRSYPGPCFVGWDYRHESPRSDLRGFDLARLAADPEDAKFDEGRVRASDQDVRADRVLANGARFYNDHGHPEYATPECWGLSELALHDKAGEVVVSRAGSALSQSLGREVRIYKNNSDFHGASYGCHESFLCPRELGFERLFRAVIPMLIARQILTGAGKVGRESGPACDYQISQRADFFVEPANAETLFRRPVFNTRDEPHADPRKWIRLHVISGDANRLAGSVSRKIGLVKLAIQLETMDSAPVWRIADPVRTFQTISRDSTRNWIVPLEGGSHTTAYELVESYLAAAEKLVIPECPPKDRSEFAGLVSECRALMESIRMRTRLHVREIDWAAKLDIVDQYREQEGLDWDSSALQAVDLEYHNIDPDEGLFQALVDSREVAAQPDVLDVLGRVDSSPEHSRAFARGVAATRFASAVKTMSWSSVTFEDGPTPREVYLDPARCYGPELADLTDVEQFIRSLETEP